MLLPPDRTLKKSLQAQLFEQLQELIHSGRLAPLTRMPATRELAEELCVSRTTVLLVYEELIAEGYLQTEPAVGTFVSAQPPRAPARLRIVGSGEVHRAATEREEHGKPHFDFRREGSDIRLFPHKVWRSIISRVLRESGQESDGDHPAGLGRLRSAVARWLSAERGLAAAPEQIVIVSGRAQAQQILARLLLTGGKLALVEAPFPQEAATIFAANARILPLPPDAGLVQRLLDGPGQRAGLIWLPVPRRASPEARLAWWKRREQLLDWASRAGAVLVEHEASDHAATPIPAASREAGAPAIRIAAVSATLSRGARLGYMVMPPHLAAPAAEARTALEDGRSWLEQMALARFIEEGGYDRHLRRVDKIFQARREALVDALHRHFGAPELDETAADHVRWTLPSELPAAAAVRRHACACGIRLDTADGEIAPPGGDSRRTLCLGYGRMEESRLVAGIARLASALAELRQMHGPGDPLEAAAGS